MNTSKLQHQTRDPQHLKHLHPALKHVPALPESSDEFLAIAAGLKKAGFIRPILIDQEERIIDDHSRTLWLAAKRWQLKEVPVQVCDSADAPLLLLNSLAHHRHLSKSAIAYLAVPHLQPALDAARLKKLENLRKGQEISERTLSGLSGNDSSAQTKEELAVELGISRTLLNLAIEVRKSFEDKKPYTFNIVGGSKDGSSATMTLKEWFEPKLLQPFVGGEHEQNRPMGLGGIKAGITAVIEGDPSKFSGKKAQQMEFFIGAFTKDYSNWHKLSTTAKNEALEAITKKAERMTAEQCEANAAALRDAAEVYADAAKSALKAGN